jgi:hypothetical protein
MHVPQFEVRRIGSHRGFGRANVHAFQEELSKLRKVAFSASCFMGTSQFREKMALGNTIEVT